MNCLRCNRDLEEGFVVDGDLTSTEVSKWVEGEPEKSLWFGTKTKGKKQLRMKAMRCKRCGHIELFGFEEDSV